MSEFDCLIYPYQFEWKGVKYVAVASAYARFKLEDGEYTSVLAIRFDSSLDEPPVVYLVPRPPRSPKPLDKNESEDVPGSNRPDDPSGE